MQQRRGSCGWHAAARVLNWLQSYTKGLTDWYPFFVLLADTGSRASEIAGLRGEDIDLVGGRIGIRAKGHKDEEK